MINDLGESLSEQYSSAALDFLSLHQKNLLLSKSNIAGKFTVKLDRHHF